MSAHNPDGLTAEQVGEGWRLLTQDEVRKLPSDAEVWAFTGAKDGHWKPSQVRGSQGFAPMSYRTRIEQPKPVVMLPNGPGRYDVRHSESGPHHGASVRENGGILEAKIPLLSRGWVTVESLAQRGWTMWESQTQ